MKADNPNGSDDSVESPRAVTMLAQKGGMGKSTTAKNLASELAQRGHRVLAVDTDDNGHLTDDLGFMGHYEDSPNLAHAMLPDDEVDPLDVIYPTDWGFDFAPATNNFAPFINGIEQTIHPTVQMKQNFVEPLLGEEYDYIVIDTPANTNQVVKNAVVASLNVIIPLAPSGWKKAFRQTYTRYFAKFRKVDIPVKTLAVFPSELDDRIDQQTTERELVERINTKELTDGGTLGQFVPDFARITEEEFDKIDSGELKRLPGIRHRSDLNEDPPIHAVNENCDQIECYKQLAVAVENRGLNRDA